MTDTEVAAAPAPVEAKMIAKVNTPKKVKEVKAKKPATKATHPSAGDMVTAAVKALAERHGSSLQAIKKYIAANYKVDVDRQALYIKKFLKSAVEKGTLVQTKGKGASGSFKLGVIKAAAKPKPKTASVEKKKAAPKKATAKKPAAKKTSEPKVSVKKATGPKKAAKKPASPKKAKAPAKPKAAAEPKAKKAAAPKAKKAAKGPTAKPKAPKPKKAAAPKAAKAPARKAPSPLAI
ncbi:Similar to Histone H1 [Cotesia congregata]|uniref:Early embryonic (Strongylocentrotus purpuratus) n=1 Tax=Cotesia congregata TaxID=51543 RepID=A0A8J2HF66_COTCN|nr:Similar to Histone H1 [Cotesia congregata]